MEVTLNQPHMHWLLGLATSRPFRPFKRYAGRVLTSYLRSRNAQIIYYPLAQDIANLVGQIRSETELLLSDTEAYQIYMATIATGKLGGEIAEVGVYRGASAKIICEAKGEKPLHLFDTFEGLPEPGRCDVELGNKDTGRLAVSLTDVQKYLGQYPNVYFYKGLFPATGNVTARKQFSFVNLDVDLYDSTMQALRYFYPRMERAGILISHDYASYQGVRKAVDEYFADKPEIVLRLTGSQCLTIKL